MRLVLKFINTFIISGIILMNISINFLFADLLNEAYKGSETYVVQKEGKDIIGGQDNILVRSSKFLMRFSAIIGVPLVLYAGLQLILSVGDEAKMKKAQKIVMYVAIGIIISLGSIAIMQIILSVTSGSTIN